MEAGPQREDAALRRRYSKDSLAWSSAATVSASAAAATRRHPRQPRPPGRRAAAGPRSPGARPWSSRRRRAVRPGSERRRSPPREEHDDAVRPHHECSAHRRGRAARSSRAAPGSPAGDGQSHTGPAGRGHGEVRTPRRSVADVARLSPGRSGARHGVEDLADDLVDRHAAEGRLGVEQQPVAEDRRGRARRCPRARRAPRPRAPPTPSPRGRARGRRGPRVPAAPPAARASARRAGARS